MNTPGARLIVGPAKLRRLLVGSGSDAGVSGSYRRKRIRDLLAEHVHRTRPLTFRQRGGSRVPGTELGHQPSQNVTDMFHHQPLEASE